MGTTAISIEEAKEEREESILALLGIIGTFLNLFVIVFVYIYTTLWDREGEEQRYRGWELLDWAGARARTITMQEDVEVDGEEEEERHSADLGRWQRDGYEVVAQGLLY